MLGQRILTALVLLAIIVPVVLAPTAIPFAWLALVLISAGMWEWARLNGCGPKVSVVSGLVFLCLAGLALSVIDLNAVPNTVWMGAALMWTTGSIWMLAKGIQQWEGVPRAVRWSLGFALLFVAWMAVVKARLLGVPFLFSVLVLVWAADIGACFSGKALGMRWFKRRLAPSISPGKTWEGALGGGAVALAVGWIWWAYAPVVQGQTHLYALLMQKGLWLWGAAMIYLVAMSVVGVLVESMVKRVAGLKDSSGLLPGHGGVLDRVDALLPTLPAALALALGWYS